MKKFLAKHGFDCKCGHSPRQHEGEDGNCTAQSTTYMFKKTNRELPCACGRYRPSLIGLLFDIWP